jgi:hypothetical protein
MRYRQRCYDGSGTLIRRAHLVTQRGDRTWKKPRSASLRSPTIFRFL